MRNGFLYFLDAQQVDRSEKNRTRKTDRDPVVGNGRRAATLTYTRFYSILSFDFDFIRSADFDVEYSPAAAYKRTIYKYIESNFREHFESEHIRFSLLVISEYRDSLTTINFEV